MSTVFLSDEDLVEIVEKRLPALMRRRPDLKGRVYAAWSDILAAIPEIAAIMAEFRNLHEEQREFRQETRQNFEQVKQQFKEVDQRFEQVDQRFEQIDQRFEQVDQRFEQVDQRFDEIRGDLKEMRNYMTDVKDWVTLTVGRVQVRAGRNLEDIVAGAMRVALKNPDIRPDQIKMRQKIVDTEGYIFPPGRQKEVDLIANNGSLIAFEVKSAAEVDDVDDFDEKVRLLKHQRPDKQVRGVFITLAPEPDVQQRCRELGIELAS
ncbi:MAG: hypothetical protein U0350_46060 [Caldilineaceae bacterium]